MLSGASKSRSTNNNEACSWLPFAYITNQAGGAISILPLSISGTIVTGVATALKVGAGALALAVDTRDNLLLVLVQGKGEIVLVSLSSGQVVGRVSGVSTGDDDGDDHEDHDKAVNIPTVTSVLPLNGRAATTFTLTLAGTNLVGAVDVIFAPPSAFRGRSEDQGRGRGLVKIARDIAFRVSNIEVNTAATQLTATVTTSAQTVVGARVVIVSTPNGESRFILVAGNTFTVIP